MIKEIAIYSSLSPFKRRFHLVGLSGALRPLQFRNVYRFGKRLQNPEGRGENVIRISGACFNQRLKCSA